MKWLGDIPAHWDCIRLKFVADLVGRKVESQTTEKYVGLENVQSNNGKFIAKEDVTPEGLSSSFSCGDVLFGKLRPYLAKSWLADISGICSSEFLVLTSKKVDARFLNYFTLTEEFITQVDSSTYGSKMPRASWDFIGLLRVPVPQTESKKIAAFLDHETAKIDALIEKQQRLIELLKEKRQAVISHAVTKGLNPNAPMKDSGVEWLGEVPAHWNVSRIKNIAQLESGHTPDKKIEEYWIDCNIPWVSLNDSTQLKAVDYITDTAFYLNDKGIANSSARKLPARCVVFTRDASIGLAAITTRVMAVSQHVIAWICDEEKVIPEYLLLVFYAMKDELERYTFGATLKTIGMADVKKLVGVFPSISEQKSIIENVFVAKEKFDLSVSKVEAAIQLSKERRTALISAAVTGKIDVRDWQAAA
ncbi:restriction endonuclease subunit S [Delftia tsuruhatensis]|uniref:restriction endonuclease subunit S n=1 Tax=Delftia tsuruhatensis TaxID=180282 RepID=UPI00244A20A7|nr:restriction endonuclease subunit S [Delftia tsuruhatensis]MDH0851239.1 restriction endonuclease subunit S [Delftia tsuruhatensis]